MYERRKDNISHTIGGESASFQAFPLFDWKTIVIVTPQNKVALVSENNIDAVVNIRLINFAYTRRLLHARSERVVSLPSPRHITPRTMIWTICHDRLARSV